MQYVLNIIRGVRSGFEGVTNAVMASAPRQPVWNTVFTTMLDRQAHYPTHDAWKDAPIYMTGPQAIKEVRQCPASHTRSPSPWDVISTA